MIYLCVLSGDITEEELLNRLHQIRDGPEQPHSSSSNSSSNGNSNGSSSNGSANEGSGNGSGSGNSGNGSGSGSNSPEVSRVEPRGTFDLFLLKSGLNY